MDFVIAADSVPQSGAAAAPTTGTPQYFGNGDINGMSPPTQIPAYFLNALMTEVMSVISRSGIGADRTNNSQMLAALIAMLAPGLFVCTGTNPIESPSWATRALGAGWGGGGFGGDAGSGGQGGGGAGGGGFGLFMFSVTGAAEIPVTIGAAGKVGSSAGGNTLFNGNLVANGGGAGGAGSSGGIGSAGVGGEAVTGVSGLLLSVAGYLGQAGMLFSSINAGGMGGGTLGTSNTYFPLNTGAATGNFPGGGGSGAAGAGQLGANGAAGLVIGTWLP